MENIKNIMTGGNVTAASVFQSLYDKGNVHVLENSAEIDRYLAERMKEITRECDEKERKSIAFLSELGYIK